MFDDLRDLQPTEPDEGEDPFAASDELLADLPTAADEPDLPVVEPFDEPVGPRFGDDIDVAVAPRPRRSGMAFGMTAQQRAVLAVFLFLDIAVLGCALLLALNKISLP